MAFLPLAAAGAATATVFGGLGGCVASFRNRYTKTTSKDNINEQSKIGIKVLKDTAIAAAAAASVASVLIAAKYSVVALMAADWAAIGASISGAGAAAVEGFLALSLATQIAIPVVAVAIVIGLVAITCFVCKKQAKERTDEVRPTSSSGEEGCLASLKAYFKKEEGIEIVNSNDVKTDEHEKQ